ncbi:MAG: hypothetical protein Q7T71_18315 [Herbiconiux sp.]|nr:hypothetical protein [Herbiconiux sp.]
MTAEEASGQRPRRSWWRRNWVGLVAFVVLAPVTVAVTFSNEWGRYYAERPSVPVDVARGEAIDYGGATWRLVEAERLPGGSAELQDAGMPEGTDLVVVTIEVEPTQLDAEGRSPLCAVTLDELDAPGGAERRTWTDAIFSSIDYEADPSAENSCVAENTSPYRYESQYIVPSDVEGPLAVQLEVVSELPRYLHLAL